MQVRKIRYDEKGGWSDEFPGLDSPNTVLFVFGASDFLARSSVVEELRGHYPQSVITGCSTSGEVFADSIHDHSLSVAVARFESTRVSLATERIEAQVDSHRVGSDLGDRLAAPDLRGVILLSDGLGVNGTELAAGLTDRLPDEVVVTGGLAGDGDRFECTWVLDENGSPVTGMVAAVGFYGESIRIGHGSRGGWDAFGPERVVTRSDGNVLFELDGKPALDLYKDYLGHRAEGLPATGLLFPLAIRRGEEGHQLVRTILAVDEEARSMTFAGDVPSGWRAQLMKANFERLIDGAADAAQQARRDDENPLTTLAIAISCVGRRLVLGERAEEEVEAACDSLPGTTELVGFYSYGEISPSSNGSCDLHNQTMTLTTIQEA